MQFTGNYNLKKPEGTDTVNINDLNDNTDIIDTQLKASQDASNTHANATSAHSATSAAAASRIIIRDASGRAKVAAPSAADDIARKDTVDAVQTNLNTHLADFVRQPGYALATGSVNAYVITLSPVPTSYVEGMAIAVRINVDNTGSSSINVNNLGAKSIKKPNGNDVSAGNLKTGSVYTMRYNGTNFILQGEGGGGTAQPEDVLAGETFTNENGEQTGTMPNVGQQIIMPGTSNQAINAGKHDGIGYVVGDADLLAANIKNGVSIFGVAGTLIQGAVLSGVQYGGTQASLGSEGKATILPVDLSKSFWICTQRQNGMDSHVYFMDDHTLRIAGIGYVEWFVLSFSSGISVQRGTGTFDGNIADIDISAVNRNKSFIIGTSQDINGSLDAQNRAATFKFLSNSQIRVERQGSAINWIISWQVISLN